MSELKERLNNAEYLDFDTNMHEFDYIYFKATRRKHDSGYYIFEIYGYTEDNDKYYKLSTYSDVIDFSQTKMNYDMCSIDMPEPSIFRVFPRHRCKIVIPYIHCSSFRIEIEEM